MDGLMVEITDNDRGYIEGLVGVLLEKGATDSKIRFNVGFMIEVCYVPNDCFETLREQRA